MTLDEYGRKHMQLISRHNMRICWKADENQSKNTISRISRSETSKI
jgi:hypothetical protein